MRKNKFAALAALGALFAGAAGVARASAVSADGCQFIRDQLADPSVLVAVVPAGTYVCAKPIIMSRSGTTLRGQGRPTLKLADHAESPLLVLGGLDDDSQGVPTPVTGLLVEGLSLDGNRANQSGECWGGPCDSGGTTAVRNSGLTIRGVKASTVRDVWITGARSGGLVTERNSAAIHVQGLKVQGSFFDGLSANWTRDSVFEDLDLSDNGYAGLTMDTLVIGNVFRDGVISDNHDVGIFLRRANSNRFEGLTVTGNHSDGVYLSDADGEAGTCAIGNAFSRVDVRCNGGDGFHNDKACAGDSLTNCSAAGNKGTQIFGLWTLSATAQSETSPSCPTP
jgi:parallel beta-helix repeat protein